MKRTWLVLGLLGWVALAANLNGVPAEFSGYDRWAKVASQGLPAGGPHAGPNKTVYANPTAAAQWKSGKPLPIGSIVVKITGPTNAPGLVAVMRKDPKGWYYVEYLPRGGRYVEAFGGSQNQQLCVGCHTSAKDKDFLFTR